MAGSTAVTRHIRRFKDDQVLDWRQAPGAPRSSLQRSIELPLARMVAGPRPTASLAGRGHHRAALMTKWRLRESSITGEHSAAAERYVCKNSGGVCKWLKCTEHQPSLTRDGQRSAGRKTHASGSIRHRPALPPGRSALPRFPERFLPRHRPLTSRGPGCRHPAESRSAPLSSVLIFISW